jgi:peptidylprolyl isomerase
MVEPGKPTDAGLNKAQMKQYIVPAVGVAAVVVLVILVVSMSGASARTMSDGSDGSAGDSKLKEIAPGVRYRDIKEGSGEECPRDAIVTIHKTGWLENGEVFDSSKEGKKNPEPATTSLGNLMKGEQEGIPGMKKGGVRKLVISSDKAYGDMGRPAGRQGGVSIPGKATLIFEVELVDFALPKNMVSGPGQPMPFDKSNGGTDDPGLKDIGEGLKIRDLKEGSGDPVKEGATVTIHYTGWTVDGNVFDDSRPRGKPNTWPLGNLVRGWQKGIPGMKPGGVRKLVVPAALGYGERGSPPNIPGGATLIFEVELVK